MRVFVTLLLAVVYGMSCNAQSYEVKPQKAEVDDYIKLLNLAKYEVFSYDISSLCDSTRAFEFVLQECECGEVKSERNIVPFYRNNRTMLSDFREEDRKKVIAEGQVYDLEKGIYSVSKKITINFFPVVNDSAETAYIDMENSISAPIPMKLRPLFDPERGKDIYMDYYARPYKVSAFEYDKFIPLAMYGSFWYDKDFHIFRSCGVEVLTPGEISDVEQQSPHYYVIGIKIHRI